MKRIGWAHVGLMALLCIGCSESNEEPEPDTGTEVEGVDMLYIGHSFGRPFAEELDDVAAIAGVDGHAGDAVKRGGASGAPDALWADEPTREEIIGKLAAGETDLLVMICCSQSFFADGSDPAIRWWIDEALAANPDTRIALALPWPDYPEDYASASAFKEFWDEGHEAWHQLIDELRADYPGVEITCLPHGRAALELRTRLEEDALPEVDGMMAGQGPGIFTDRKGHADTVLLDTGTLVWLGALYGVDSARYPAPGGYETDVVGIAADIVADDSYVFGAGGM